MSREWGGTIKFVPQVGGTPYLGYAVRAHAALLEHGHADPHVSMVGWDNQGVFAIGKKYKDQDETVGCITYNHNKWVGSYGILIGFVSEHFRGAGVYRKLWSALVARAKEEEVAIIDSAVHADNIVMREVAKKLGRTAESINFRYHVPLC